MADPNGQGIFVILLPHGPVVSGIVNWATRLAAHLPRFGWKSAVLLHRARPDQTEVVLTSEDDLHASFIRLPLNATCAVDFSHDETVACYVEHLVGICRMAEGHPVVMAPNVDHLCWGAAVDAVTHLHRVEPGLDIRCLGWTHSNSPYDLAVTSYYEPIMASLVAPSTPLAEAVRTHLPNRAADVHMVHYPIGLPRMALHSEHTDPASNEGQSLQRPLRLLYTGRLDLPQKRVDELIELSRRLSGLGIEHALRVIGDGPAAPVIADAARSMSAITHYAPMSYRDLVAHLEWADAFVLTSRWEGLSVAMLEAMACRTVPVVTRVSGVERTIEHGVNGLLYSPGDLSKAARLLATLAGPDAGPRRIALATAAQATARAIADPARHAEAVARVLTAIARPKALGKDRVAGWPTVRPSRMPSGGLAGLPMTRSQVRRRLALTLAALVSEAAARPVRLAVWGGGAHTLELADLLKGCPVLQVILDDAAAVDGHATARERATSIETARSIRRQTHGAAVPAGRGGAAPAVAAVAVEPRRLVLGRPVHPPASAARLGITDVILSSALYEPTLWDRRHEVAPARVHRLYG